MPVHSIIVLNHQSGNVLFSKYFHSDTVSNDVTQQMSFEQALFEETSQMWRRPIVSKQTTSIFIDDDRDDGNVLEQIPVYVVLQRVGEFILFASGYDDVDEMVLVELLDALIEVMKEILTTGGGSFSESDFLNTDKYGKQAKIENKSSLIPSKPHFHHYILCSQVYIIRGRNGFPGKKQWSNHTINCLFLTCQADVNSFDFNQGVIESMDADHIAKISKLKA